MWRPHSTHAHSTASTTPLTSTVKSSLFMHELCSPLSLVASLNQYCANQSRYINNGWTFSKQTSYFWVNSVRWTLLKRKVHSLLISLFLKMCLLILEREEHQCERETSIGCLPFTPWPWIKPATSVCALTGDPRIPILLVYGMMHQPTEPYWPELLLSLFSFF